MADGIAGGSEQRVSPGTTGEARRVVSEDQTAIRLGSGDVEVFGTPALLAMMEEAAVAALHGSLPPDRTSVGISVSLEHLAPSRLGTEVRAIARVVSATDRRITFSCEAWEGETLIGRAEHARAIVDRARFGR